jgi:hypothetical protein
MQTANRLESQIAACTQTGKHAPLCALIPTAALVVSLILSGQAEVAAQAPTQPAPSGTVVKPAHHRKHSNPSHPTEPPAPIAAVPEPPPTPEAPNWPANDHPTEASIVWDSQGLRINAANSSLQQILKDVSTATGAKVDGFSTDQRIFGVYGPGPARDVLSAVLQGSGYNVMMIGDQGQGTPRQILLTIRHSGDSAPAANGAQSSNSDEDSDAEEPPPPQQAPPPQNRLGFTPGGPPRTPQQIMQEMQQRQQQMQQQQQNNPQN